MKMMVVNTSWWYSFWTSAISGRDSRDKPTNDVQRSSTGWYVSGDPVISRKDRPRCPATATSATTLRGRSTSQWWAGRSSSWEPTTVLASPWIAGDLSSHIRDLLILRLPWSIVVDKSYKLGLSVHCGTPNHSNVWYLKEVEKSPFFRLLRLWTEP